VEGPTFLSSAQIVGIYFAGSTCAASKRFTPTLTEACKLLNNPEDSPVLPDGKKISILLVSTDVEEGAFTEYIDSLPSDWYHVPFNFLAARRKVSSVESIINIDLNFR
jgi:hypothetical protein